MTIKPDQSKSYRHVENAVVDAGYILHQGYVKIGKKSYGGWEQLRDIFYNPKNDKHYVVDSYDHYNTTIYSIKLKLADALIIEFVC